MDFLKSLFEMEITTLLAHGVGLIGIVMCFFVYFSQTRERILIFKFISDSTWLVNYLLLGGYTGALINGINMVRELIYYNRGKRAWASSHIWLFVFIIANSVSPLYSLFTGDEGYYALLPAAGSVLNAIALYLKKPQNTRFIGFGAQILWLTYTLYANNPTATAANVVLLISAIAGTIRQYLSEKKEKSLQ